MTEITAQMVKDLRESTSAGMLDCKKALTETNGDMEAAVDWLRKKGLASAAKKASRIAAEGLVAVAVDGNKGAVVEVNSETDFVAKNDMFQEYVADAALVALMHNGEVCDMKTFQCPKVHKSFEERLTDLIAKIGENMNLRRAAMLEVSNGVIASYVHNACKPNLGKNRRSGRSRIERRQSQTAGTRQTHRHARCRFESAVSDNCRRRPGFYRSRESHFLRTGQSFRQA